MNALNMLCGFSRHGLRPAYLAATLVMALPSLVTADDTSETQRLVAQGVKARDGGRWVAAEGFLKEAIGRAERINDGPNRVAAYHELAVLQHTRGKYPEAVDLHETALGYASSTFGEADQRYVTCLINFGEALSDLGKYQQARRNLEKAYGVVKALPGPKTELEVTTRSGLGVLCRREGSAKEAIGHYAAILKLLDPKVPANTPAICMTLINMSYAYSESGNAAEAERVVLDARDKLEQAKLESTVIAAGGLLALARIKLDGGKPTEAVERAAESLAVCRAVTGEQHPRVAACLEVLADSKLKNGDVRKARDTFRRVVALRESTLGPRHPLTGETVARRARAEQATGDGVAATESFRAGYAILVESFGGKLPTRFKWVTDGYAGMLLERGRAEEAEKVKAALNVRDE